MNGDLGFIRWFLFICVEKGPCEISEGYLKGTDHLSAHITGNIITYSHLVVFVSGHAVYSTQIYLGERTV